MDALETLMSRFAQPGRVEWIGLRPRYRGAVESVRSVLALEGRGLSGDHGAERAGGKRQVTLIQWEHLGAIARLLGRDDIDPVLLRRNIVVSGINLLALKDRPFQIGEALLVGTGPCAPCSRMEAALGLGGFNAMRGHGGITAKIICGGQVAVGDAVHYVAPREPAQQQLPI